MYNQFMSHEDREELNYEMFWRTISRCRTIGELLQTEINPRYAGTRNWFDRYEVASGEYILVCQDCGTIQFSDHEETDPCLVCGFGKEETSHLVAKDGSIVKTQIADLSSRLSAICGGLHRQAVKNALQNISLRAEKAKEELRGFGVASTNKPPKQNKPWYRQGEREEKWQQR